MQRGERFLFFFFLFEGGVYQPPETNLPPHDVSIIIILPIYTTALVQFTITYLTVRLESVRNLFHPQARKPRSRHLANQHP